MKVSTEQVTQSVAPASEPVTTAEIKAHLRIDTSDEDTLLDAYVAAARLFCENYTARSFVDRTYVAKIPDFADTIVLPYRPIVSISSIKYWDTASPSVQQTLAASTYSLVNNCLVRTYGETWPSVYPRLDAVEITYIAGDGTSNSPAASVNEAVKAAIKLIVGDLYENREGKIVGMAQSDNPTVMRLLHPYRVYL